MKKYVFLVASLFTLSGSFAAASVIRPQLNAADICITIGKAGRMISLLDLSRMKVKDVELQTGQKMKFLDRVGLKIAQWQLKKYISRTGHFTTRKVERYFQQLIDGKTGFHAGGFALGFISWFLFLFGGILIAYLIRDGNRKNRIKWAWIGFVSAFLFFSILFFAGAFGLGF